MLCRRILTSWRRCPLLNRRGIDQRWLRFVSCILLAALLCFMTMVSEIVQVEVPRAGNFYDEQMAILKAQMGDINGDGNHTNSTNITRNNTIDRQTVNYTSEYDPFIQIVMDTKDQCANASSYHAIMAVHSAPGHFLNREMFRWLYGDFVKTDPFRIKVVFLLGLVTNSTLHAMLMKENLRYGDIVQGNFIDCYKNMTYKAVMGFNWVDINCKGLKSFLRLDDDVYMNVPRLLYRWKYAYHKHRQKMIMCDAFSHDLVRREGKWAVPRSVIPEDYYEFIRCAGYFAAVTPDLVHSMAVVAKRTPFFWIDDIVMYGLVPSAIGGIHFQRTNKMTSRPNTQEMFTYCYLTQGKHCKFIIGVADVRNFKRMYEHMARQ